MEQSKGRDRDSSLLLAIVIGSSWASAWRPETPRSPAFILAQVLGAIVATLLGAWLFDKGERR